MQKGENHGADPIALPVSPSNNATLSGGFQPTAKLRDKLNNLARWRIDPSALEFPNDARESRGGSGTVSRALWVSPSGGPNGSGQSNPAQKKGLNLPPSPGETSWWQMLWNEALRLFTVTSSSPSAPIPQAVAVKKMVITDDPARVLGLTLREAEFLVNLSHENVIRLEGFVEDLSKDIIWLVFPWEDNGTLKDFIASGDWEIPERISLINDVTRGVEYLHSRQPPIRHGDLKSINVLVNSDCRAVITDFGSARHLTATDLNQEAKQAENGQKAALSLEATLCGSTNTVSITLTGDVYTLRWAAPELLREEEATLASDIWALGWVAYEVMTNSIPFQNVVKDAVVIIRVIQGNLPSITSDVRLSLIRSLCSLMLVCWRIDPRERPTAEDCQKSMSWMPMIVPTRIRTPDTLASRTRSPALLVQLGRMHARQGDHAKALDFFTNAVGSYGDIGGDRQGKAAALAQLAYVHQLQNDYSQAIKFYSEALQIRTDIGDRLGRDEALFGLAEVHRLRNEYSQAILYYSEILQLRTYIGDRQGRAAALWSLAEVYRVQNRYDQADTFYSEALQIRTDVGDKQGRASTLCGLAMVHRARNDYNQAITFYSEALEIRTDIGDKQGRADALWGLAELHRDRSEYSQAIALYSEALQIRIEIGDRQGRADALWSLAEVHRLQNEYSQAVTLYSEALQIRTNIGDRQGRADALFGLAEVHRLQNEHDQAVTSYWEALQIRTDIGDRQGRANALQGLAEEHRVRNEYTQAIKLYSEVLEIYTDIGDRSGIAFTLLDLADVHRDQGHYSDAIRPYTEAAEIFEQIEHTEGEAYASYEAAEIRRLSPREEAHEVS